MTTLANAVRTGNLPAIKQLCGVNRLQLSRAVASALVHAIRDGNRLKMRELATHAARNPFILVAGLFEAVVQPTPDAAALLIAMGAKPTDVPVHGRTLFDRAVAHGNFDIVKLLLATGSPPTGYAGIHAVRAVDQRIVRLLMRTDGFDLNHLHAFQAAGNGDDGNGPLVYKTMFQVCITTHLNVAMAATMLSNPSLRPHAGGFNPLQEALDDSLDADAVFQMLLDDPRVVINPENEDGDHDGDPVLMLAIVLGRLSRVEQLLASPKNDPLVTDDNGDTPLHVATTNGTPAMLKLLLTNAQIRQNIDEPGHRNRPVITTAVAVNNLVALSALLLAGADPNARTGTGITALQLATLDGNLAAALILRAAGANPLVVGTVDADEDGGNDDDVASGRCTALVALPIIAMIQAAPALPAGDHERFTETVGALVVHCIRTGQYDVLAQDGVPQCVGALRGLPAHLGDPVKRLLFPWNHRKTMEPAASAAFPWHWRTVARIMVHVAARLDGSPLHLPIELWHVVISFMPRRDYQLPQAAFEQIASLLA